MRRGFSTPDPPIRNAKRERPEQGNYCEADAGAGTRHGLSRQQHDKNCETAEGGKGRCGIKFLAAKG